MARIQDFSRWHGIYKSAPCERSDGEWPLCMYCGVLADTIDHVPPITRVDDYRALWVKHAYWKVKCCSECNFLAADSLQSDFLERVQYVKEKLKLRYRRRAVNAPWSKAEIKELGRTMKTEAAKGLKIKCQLDERLNYWGGVRAMINEL